MNNIDFNALTFEEISKLDLSIEERLEAVFSKIAPKEKEQVLKIWENGKINDNLLFPFYVREIHLLKPIMSVFFKEEGITVSEISGMYLDEPSKLEFEVHDDKNDKIYDIDLSAYDDIDLFLNVWHMSSRAFPRFGDGARVKYEIYVCPSDPFNYEEHKYEFFPTVSYMSEDDIPPSPEEQRQNTKDLKWIFDTSLYNKNDDADLRELIAYFNGNSPESDLTRAIDSNIIEVKEDKWLLLEFVLKYVKFILRI